MECTDCFLAADEHHAFFSGIQEEVRFFDRDVAVISRIVESVTRSTLVITMCDQKDNDGELAKIFFTHFAQMFASSKGSHTQFTLSFLDESAGDIIHCPCDYATEVDVILDEENNKYRCCSLRASTVEPTENSFAFTDVCLTFLMWSEEVYGGNLARVVDRIATSFGTKFTSICVYFAGEKISELDRYIAMAKELQHTCKTSVFGEEKRVSQSTRMHSVRAWSLMVNEFHHFSPQVEGPYFVNLNPQLVVGEKLAHAIFPGISYIVANVGVASPVDVVVCPTKKGESEEVYQSICSPHCRISFEGGNVSLRPACGLTYVNGAVLSSETNLQHNDRIILGQEIALRFVMVKEKPTQNKSSRILDWEMCCKEFDRGSKNTVEQAMLCRVEKELNDTKEQYNMIRRQLKIGRESTDCIWVILTNPPSDFNDSFVWELGWVKMGDSITIGPGGDLALPFLVDSTVLFRTVDGFRYKCNGVNVNLIHGSRFLIGDLVFSVSIKCDKSKEYFQSEEAVPEEIGMYTDDDIRDVRNRLFELQWTISMLFDFVIPPEKLQEKGRENKDDVNYLRRKEMHSDAILTSKKLRLDSISRLAEMLTKTIRVINSELVPQIGCINHTEELFATMSGAEGSRCTAEDLLDIISRQTSLSYDVLRKMHDPIDRVLVNGDTQAEGNSKEAREQLNVKESGNPDVSPSTVKDKVLAIRAHFFLASKIVVKRMGTTVDAISMSTKPNELWSRYVKTLHTHVGARSDLKAVPSSKKESIALALVDVIVALEYILSKGPLSTSEEESVAKHFPSWMAIAENFSDCFKKPPSLKRVGLRLESPALRKTTPRPRHVSPAPSSLKPRQPFASSSSDRIANGRTSLSVSNRQSTLRTRAASAGARRPASGFSSPTVTRTSVVQRSLSNGKAPSAPRTNMGRTPGSSRSPTPLSLLNRGQRASFSPLNASTKATQSIRSNASVRRSLGETASCPPSRSTNSVAVKSMLGRPTISKARISCQNKK